MEANPRRRQIDSLSKIRPPYRSGFQPINGRNKARLICRNLSTEFTDLGMVVESMDVCPSTSAIKIGKLAISDSKDSTFIARANTIYD
nr:hypothetical protein Itr_chr01CG03490 [Ipomoea trifida]